MIIYDLQNGGRMSFRCEGLFLSLEGAKARAAEVLEEYHEMDDLDDVEGINYDAVWVVQQETIGPRKHPVGEDKPTLNYGEDGSRFVIREREVHP